MRMRRYGVLMTVLSVMLAARATGQSTPPTWRVTEQWRVDGTEGGQPFGSVRDMVIGKDGTLWVLDYKDQSIRRFDANGKPLANVGRVGSGPGEMQKANGLLVARDGFVWVNDPTQKRFTVFSAAGTFARQFVIMSGGYGYRWDAWLDRRTGDVIDLAIVRRQGATQSTMEWRRITVAGEVRDTMAMPTCATADTPRSEGFKAESKDGNMFGSYPYTTGGGRAADGSGGMWCATPSSQRAVLLRIGKGDTMAVSALSLPSVPVDKLERDSSIASAQARVARYATNTFDPAKIPATKPPIATLGVDDDGRLWIQHASRMNARTVTFDVHNGKGKHLGRVVIPQRLAQEQIPLRARGADLWVATRDDDDVVNVVKYRITP